ncbi:hypothetical protein D3C86_2118640 [compost metagenome]
MNLDFQRRHAGLAGFVQLPEQALPGVEHLPLVKLGQGEVPFDAWNQVEGRRWRLHRMLAAKMLEHP